MVMFGIEKDFQKLMEQVYGPLNKNKMTEKPDTINLKNYIGKKVTVFFRNLKKVEGYITYDRQYRDYPYGFNDRRYTKDGKILIDDELNWDIMEIFTEQQPEIDISKVLIEGDTATIMGVKYKRVEEQQSFYDKLWGLLKTKLGDSVECDEMADRVRDLIREHIPKNKKGVGLPEYYVGYNDAIQAVKLGLFNGIQ